MYVENLQEILFNFYLDIHKEQFGIYLIFFFF